MTAMPELRDLRDVDAADVYKAGRLAGHLRRGTDDTVEFSYEPAYLDDLDTVDVAFSLPKVSTPAQATAGSLPPFFSGLLPEGVRLAALTRAARTSVDDHLTLLLAVGADVIGDVQVVPSRVSPQEPPVLFDPARAAEEDFAEVFARAASGDTRDVDRIALPGVQVKVSSAMLSTPLRTTAGPALLKLDPPEYPHLVANEHFFLRMAQDCRIPVPRHELVYDGQGRAGLLVERFDRVPTGRDRVPRRLAQEDACQVMGRYPAAKYRLRLQDVVGALGTAVAAGGGSRPLAIRRVLEIAVFSYVIGNGDLHGKNLSIRQDAQGLWEITPAYDLISTQPYLGWNDPMALPFFGRANRLSRRWWLEAGERLGLPRRAVVTVVERIVQGSHSWLDRVHEIGFDDAVTTRLRDLLAARARELTDG